MSVLQAVMSSNKPVAALRLMWSSLGTNAFLEKIAQDLHRSACQSCLKALRMNIETKQRIALMSWRAAAKEASLDSLLHKYKEIASKLFKDKRRQTMRAAKVEIKGARPEVVGTLNDVNPLHLRSHSQELQMAEELLHTPTHQKQSYKKTVKNWTDRSPRPHSIESSLKSPVQKDQSLMATLKSGLQKKATRLSSTDVGTRLFNKAQEIIKKKELLRQSYAPKYSFTPQLAPQTDRRGSQRTPLQEGDKDEVAVVSSSLGILRMGDAL